MDKLITFLVLTSAFIVKVACLDEIIDVDDATNIAAIELSTKASSESDLTGNGKNFEKCSVNQYRSTRDTYLLVNVDVCLSNEEYQQIESFVERLANTIKVKWGITCHVGYIARNCHGKRYAFKLPSDNGADLLNNVGNEKSNSYGTKKSNSYNTIGGYDLSRFSIRHHNIIAINIFEEKKGSEKEIEKILYKEHANRILKVFNFELCKGKQRDKQYDADDQSTSKIYGISELLEYRDITIVSSFFCKQPLNAVPVEYQDKNGKIKCFCRCPAGYKAERNGDQMECKKTKEHCNCHWTRKCYIYKVSEASDDDICLIDHLYQRKAVTLVPFPDDNYVSLRNNHGDLERRSGPRIELIIWNEHGTRQTRTFTFTWTQFQGGRHHIINKYLRFHKVGRYRVRLLAYDYSLRPASCETTIVVRDNYRPQSEVICPRTFTNEYNSYGSAPTVSFTKVNFDRANTIIKKFSLWRERVRNDNCGSRERCDSIQFWKKSFGEAKTEYKEGLHKCFHLNSRDLANLRSYFDTHKQALASRSPTKSNYCTKCCAGSQQLKEKVAIWKCNGKPENKCLGRERCKFEQCLHANGRTFFNATSRITDAQQEESKRVLKRLHNSDYNCVSQIHLTVPCHSVEDDDDVSYPQQHSKKDKDSHYHNKLLANTDEEINDASEGYKNDYKSNLKKETKKTKKVCVVEKYFSDLFELETSFSHFRHLFLGHHDARQFVRFRYSINDGKWHPVEHNTRVVFQSYTSIITIEAWSACGRVHSARYWIHLHPHRHVDYCSYFEEHAIYQTLTSNKRRGGPLCNYPHSDFAEVVIDFDPKSAIVGNSDTRITPEFKKMLCSVEYDGLGYLKTSLLSHFKQERLFKRYAVDLINNPFTQKFTTLKISCEIYYETFGRIGKQRCHKRVRFEDCDRPGWDCPWGECRAFCKKAKRKPYQTCSGRRILNVGFQTHVEEGETWPCCEQCGSVRCEPLEGLPDGDISRCVPHGKPPKRTFEGKNIYKQEEQTYERRMKSKKLREERKRNERYRKQQRAESEYREQEHKEVERNQREREKERKKERQEEEERIRDKQRRQREEDLAHKDELDNDDDQQQRRQERREKEEREEDERDRRDEEEEEKSRARRIADEEHEHEELEKFKHREFQKKRTEKKNSEALKHHLEEKQERDDEELYRQEKEAKLKWEKQQEYDHDQQVDERTKFNRKIKEREKKSKTKEDEAEEKKEEQERKKMAEKYRDNEEKRRNERARFENDEKKRKARYERDREERKRREQEEEENDKEERYKHRHHGRRRYDVDYGGQEKKMERSMKRKNHYQDEKDVNNEMEEEREDEHKQRERKERQKRYEEQEIVQNEERKKKIERQERSKRKKNRKDHQEEVENSYNNKEHTLEKGEQEEIESKERRRHRRKNHSTWPELSPSEHHPEPFALSLSSDIAPLIKAQATTLVALVSACLAVTGLLLLRMRSVRRDEAMQSEEVYQLLT